MNRTYFMAVALAAACVLFTGCDDVRHEGDRIIVTRHWASMLPFVGTGVAMLTSGALLAAGRIGRKPKPAGGAWLIVLGTAFVLGGALTVPFSRVTADSERFVIQQGLLGRGISEIVEMDSLQSIEVYQQKYSSRTRARRIIAKFVQKQGSPIHIRIDYVNAGWRTGGRERTVALDHFLRLARDRGIPVSDRRNIPVP